MNSVDREGEKITELLPPSDKDRNEGGRARGRSYRKVWWGGSGMHGVGMDVAADIP